MDNPGGRIEAERLLSIAENLLQTRDLAGSREFAVLAQETEPLLDGSDQILSICDVLLAGEKRMGSQKDWYGILQVDRRSNDLDLIKRNYRRLALLLHPDKNKYPLSNSAFRLVADAWALLSDHSKKSTYDAELSHFSKVELTPRPLPQQQQHQQQQQQPQQDHSSDKLPVRRSPRPPPRGGGGDAEGNNTTPAAQANFWTACPYCYVLYEYPRVFEDCCLRCQSCERAFHAAVVPSLPPMVPGKEAYYCCWGFFPLGFSVADDPKKGAGAPNSAAFPDWMPPLFSSGTKAAPAPAPAPPAPTPAPKAAAPVQQQQPPPPPRRETTVPAGMPDASAAIPQPPPPTVAAAGMPLPGQKKRGRPRKNPL